MKKIAIVRIRGDFNLSPKVRSTLAHLNLHTKNCCVVVDASPSILGMIKIIKDLVTWGDVTSETLAVLTPRSVDKNTYRLHPPRKGYGKKGIKFQYVAGGALGDRKDAINDLLTRMI